LVEFGGVVGGFFPPVDRTLVYMETDFEADMNLLP